MTSSGTDTRDGRRVRGARTRDSILARAVEVASEHGLDGLSIGGLADDLGLSKSGLFAHFGAKEELQLATIDAARERFVEAVVRPARGTRGATRVRALADAFLAHVRDSVFPGGCFFAAVATEYDSRPGPIRDAIAANILEWRGALEAAVQHGIDAGEIDASTQPAFIAFAVWSLLSGANLDYQLRHDVEVFVIARRGIDQLLALAEI
jgi:AcrR family transcriptional regulator